MSGPNERNFPRTWLGTIGKFSGLTLRCIFQPTARLKMRDLALYLHYYDVKPTIPVKSYVDLIGHEPVIKVFNSSHRGWGLGTAELLVVNAFVVALEPDSIFEFGTYLGRTTLNMFHNAKEGCKITTLDLPVEQQRLPVAQSAGLLIRDLVDAGKIQMLFGNSRTYDFSNYFGTQDLVFIDAAHHYDDVKSDTAIALELIRGRRACIIWDDYLFFAGVTRAVHELSAERPNLGNFYWIEGTRLACLMT